MNTTVKYTFENGHALRVYQPSNRDDEKVKILLFDSNNSLVVADFSEGHIGVLNALLQKYNQTVSFAEIFKSYTGQVYHFSDRDLITKEISSLRRKAPGIAEYIKSVRSRGYKICIKDKGVDTDDNTQEEILKSTSLIHSQLLDDGAASEMSWMLGLVGDYYGFYLDRKGSGRLFGVYMHIENLGTANFPDLKVSAIIGIDSGKILFGEDIANVFAEQKDYTFSFAKFKQKWIKSEEYCFLSTGKITHSGSIVEILMKSSVAAVGEEWHVYLDLTGYKADPRSLKGGLIQYTSGVGLAFSIRSIFGNCCFRYAIVRKNVTPPSVNLENSLLREVLIISDSNDKWKPVSMENSINQSWYNWCTNEYTNYIAIATHDSFCENSERKA